MMLSEIIEFNPIRSIKKGTNAPFIEMAALKENARDISYIFQKEFNGSGTKFKNGDTLLARITPCLENGKTAKVNCLKEGEHAHGSTEFIVLKAKEPEYDEDFIYYLCRWSKFRDYAIGRMEGTSGRQRVDWKAIAEFECELPVKEERKKIGFFLKQIDDKIANNNRINQTIESIVQAIFKSWFVDFDLVKAKTDAKENGEDPVLAAVKVLCGKSNEKYNFSLPEYDELRAIADLFPNEFEESELGLVPEGWKITKIENAIDIIKHKNKIKKTDYKKDGRYPVIDQGREFIAGYTNDAKSVYNVDAIVFGDHTRILKMINFPFSAGADGTKLLTNKKNVTLPYFLYVLLLENPVSDYKYERHYKYLVEIKFVLPSFDIVEAYEKKVKPFFQIQRNNLFQNQRLEKIRDVFLSKLISKKIVL